MLRSRLPWLTFDCYDTLVRYSESKAEALAALVRAKGGDDVTVDAVQATFEARERSIQTGPFTSLADVLKQSLRDALDAASLPQAPEDDETMLAAVRGAVPFPDVPAVLAELKVDHRLAILSNSQPDIISYNIVSIGVEFDAVVLATEAKCYKPDPGMFRELLDRIDAAPGDVTHIAQSFYHDMRTAKDLGFGRRLWISRFGREGDPAYTPDAELEDLVGVRAQLG